MPSAPASRLAAVDGLRLIAALAVAVYHYVTSWRLDGHHLPEYFLPVASHLAIYGFLGVELFFLISGFVIGMSTWGRTLRGFAVSRVSRLYPALWACVVITAAVVTALPVTEGVPGDQSPLRPAEIAVNLTMFPAPLGVRMVDTVYWTLWAELRFYLLFAVLAAIGLTYRRAVVFCVAWLAAVLVAPALHSALLETVLIADFAPYFIAGVALHLIHRFGPNLLLGGLVGVCWLVSLPRAAERLAGANPGFAVPIWPGLLIMTGCYLVLLLVALRRTDRITWSWLTVAGALTYPFYLLHQRIGYALMRTAHDHTGLPAAVLVVAALAMLLGVAYLVHRWVERPGTALLKRLLGGAERRPGPGNRRSPDSRTAGSLQSC